MSFHLYLGNVQAGPVTTLNVSVAETISVAEAVTPFINALRLSISQFDAISVVDFYNPFPIRGILDDFNRADADPISGNWTIVNPAQGLAIVSNRARIAAGDVDGYGRLGISIGPDFELYATIVSAGVYQADNVSIELQALDEDLANGYALDWALFSNDLRVYRVDGLGSFNQLLFIPGNGAPTYPLGVGLRRQGERLEVWRRYGTAPWARMGFVDDDTYTGPWSPYLYMLDAAGGLGDDLVVDDYGGGTMPLGQLDVSVRELVRVFTVTG